MATRVDFSNSNWDFVGLSEETKPTENVGNGSTFYEVDTSTLYIYYEEEWYEQQ